MALKGPLWVMGKCLDEERKRTPLSFLASRALDLGIGKVDKTRGHAFQACGAVQRFFEQYPQHKATIAKAPAFSGYQPKGQVLKDWNAFIKANSGEYGGHNFGLRYNYDTLKGYLTPKYGGRRKGGGGGDNEFEIILRLVAEF